MTCWALLSSVLVASTALAQPVHEPFAERRGVALSDRLVLEADGLTQLPSSGSISNVLSRVLLPSLFSLEESMGFSDIEPERLSLSGDSAVWTEWRLEDLSLSDPFFEGAAAFKVPFVFISQLELQTAESARHSFGGGLRIGVAPVAGRPTRGARVSFGVGGVGGTIPGAERISDFITTAHARSREVQPEEDRRRFLGRLQASLFDTEAVAGHTLRYAVEVDGNARHHNEFPSFERDQAGLPFTEKSLRVSGIAELAPASRAWRVYALGEYRHRDHLFAERRFSRAETVGLSSGGLLVGLVADGLRAGLTFKHDRLTPTGAPFTRELLDADGEGFFPFVPTGAMNSVHLDLGYRKFDVYVASDLRLLAWTGSATREHPLTFMGTPYGSLTLASQPTATVIGSHRLGYSKQWAWRWFELAVDGYGVVNHANAAGTTGLGFPDVGAKVQAVLPLAPWFQPFLNVARTPISIPSQTALALTPGYSSSTERLADGRFVQAFGGDLTRIEPLRSPNIYSVVFGITSRLGAHWKVTMQGIAKAWHSLSRLSFDGPATDVGRFVGDAFYFNGQPSRYRLENDPYVETPYGGMVQLEVARLADENGFFTASFSAANFFGHPAFGNGPYGNDIGLIDFQGANPNARHRSLANTDADRAFILKVVGAKRFWKTLWGSFAIFYKDGQPFGFYDVFVDDNQVALRRNSNRGSPRQISSPLIGWREDFQVEVDLRVGYDFVVSPQWTVRVGAIVANVLDLGNEVSERHWPPYDRSSLELQLPRSVNLTVELLGSP